MAQLLEQATERTVVAEKAVSDESASIAAKLLDSLVLVRSHRGAGSGVVWDPSGAIVTNSHVARGSRVGLMLGDGTELDAEVVARDQQVDLAVLRPIETIRLRAAEIGDSTALRPGQFVLAAGNPYGLRGVVTAGIVTSTGESYLFGRRWPVDLIRADVSLLPGNSGGPLADARGRVIGINAMVEASGSALAIPSQAVQRFLYGAVDWQRFS